MRQSSSPLHIEPFSSATQTGEVWALADSKRQGFLGFPEVVAAMQLVSLAQAGQEITSYTIKSTADMGNVESPKMEGIDSLLAKNKGSTLNHNPELNGSAQLQKPVTAPRCNSKSCRKMPLNAVPPLLMA